MTLLKIAELIAERGGRQFEIPFRKEVEDMIVYWRARILKDTLERKMSLKKYYMQSILDELEEVNKEECEELGECGCENVLRTKHEIPQTIRASPNPYDYIGSEGGYYGYAWTTFGAEKFFGHNKYTKSNPRWTLLNNRIYIFRDKNIKNVRIEGVFSDPRTLGVFMCPGSTKSPCYSATSDFNADDAMIQLIVTGILATEFRQKPKEDNIEITSDKNV